MPDFKAALTKKVGPFPVYYYAVGGGVVLLVWAPWRKKGGSGSSKDIQALQLPSARGPSGGGGGGGIGGGTGSSGGGGGIAPPRTGRPWVDDPASLRTNPTEWINGFLRNSPVPIPFVRPSAGQPRGGGGGGGMGGGGGGSGKWDMGFLMADLAPGTTAGERAKLEAAVKRDLAAFGWTPGAAFHQAQQAGGLFHRLDEWMRTGRNWMDVDKWESMSLGERMASSTGIAGYSDPNWGNPALGYTVRGDPLSWTAYDWAKNPYSEQWQEYMRSQQPQASPEEAPYISDPARLPGAPEETDPYADPFAGDPSQFEGPQESDPYSGTDFGGTSDVDDSGFGGFGGESEGSEAESFGGGESSGGEEGAADSSFGESGGDYGGGESEDEGSEGEGAAGGDY